MNIKSKEFTVIINSCLRKQLFRVTYFQDRQDLNKDKIDQLKAVSMVFERRFNKYLDNVKSSIFSPCLSGFRENHDFQLFLLKIAEA